MNKILHRLLVFLIVGGLTLGISGVGLVVLRRSSIKTIKVTRVSNIVEEDYYDDSVTNMSGSVVSNVTQNISLSSGLGTYTTSSKETKDSGSGESDISVDQVFVSEGDKVKVGDSIISFDTTIAEMKLNIQRMKLQLAQMRLNIIYAKLDALKNGASLEEVNKIGEDENSELAGMNDSVSEGDDDELVSLPISERFLRVLKKPFLLLWDASVDVSVGAEESDAAEEDTEDDTEEENLEDGEENDGEPLFDSGENKFTDGGEDNDLYFDSEDGTANYPTVNPEAQQFTDGTTNSYGDLTGDGNNGVYPWLTQSSEELASYGVDGLKGGDEDPFYRYLTETTLPFEGQGTAENPYIFLCTCAKGRVTVTGGFLNVMAGYNATGTVKERDGFWYQLEWHRYDTITDYNNRKKSCTGYYIIDGNTLQRGVDISARTDFELDNALTYPEEDEPEEDDPEEDDPEEEDPEEEEDQEDPSLRTELIKSYTSQANSMLLEIRKQELAIEKQEKLVSKKLITAKIDGIVSHVGDISKGGSNVITIKSSEGYYVKGTVNELDLDRFPVGTKIQCSDWMYGMNFTATVSEVSEYPVTSNENYYDGNSNASSYSFTATIDDQDSLSLTETAWLEIKIIEDAKEDSSLVIDRAFVRSENGSHYVYKDVDGFLKKHYIKVDSFISAGYYAKVSAGLKRSDRVAFPYGADIKEGLPTVEVSLYDITGDY